MRQRNKLSVKHSKKIQMADGELPLNEKDRENGSYCMGAMKASKENLNISN